MRDDRVHDQELHDQGVSDSLSGKGNDLKGRVKDAAGGLTGDSSLQAEGKGDQLKGKLQDTLGKVERKLSE
jgi:uncharacterized protein YjbJ (UPF0337 family)